MRRVLPGVLALVCVAACTFAPDLSRYDSCDAQGACPSGFTCLASESRCVPDCGELDTCEPVDPTPGADAGDSGTDAGADAGADAGDDAGTGVDAGEDGGADAGVDAGTEETDAGPVVALALDPDALGTAQQGRAYSGRLRARGGTPPYTFTATVALPAGLGLDGDGQLTGMPAAAGDFFLSINVTDRSTPSQQASGSIPLRVYSRLLLAGPGMLVDGVQNKAYSERLSAIGGKTPHRFTLANGSTLPAGLQLAEDGRVTGTCGPVGSASFTVEVTDSDSPPQVSTLAVSMRTISAGGLNLIALTQGVPDGRVGSTYSYALRSTAGRRPSRGRGRAPCLPASPSSTARREESSPARLPSRAHTR
ncbi:putative Ig domain-containing protein [Pyxidicoccus sp. MSG2]|nr:putative Ig domain-containing protein [Pyxidicoccus sp. MSG2]MCY1018518.1 putative Ig domain-containing protein [Pyxidicoccus sp. MSG2]